MVNESQAVKAGDPLLTLESAHTGVHLKGIARGHRHSRAGGNLAALVMRSPNLRG